MAAKYLRISGLTDFAGELLNGVYHLHSENPIETKWAKDGGAFNQHWVTIVGKRGNDYIITDPWTADLVPLTRYENKIYRLAGYSRD